MGHTNSTANLSLPQFIGTDKPTWLGDVNGAFSAIDSYAGTNDAAVSAAVSDASSAISQAAAAVNTANTANTTAGNASTAANNAIGVANTANAIAGTVDAKVGLLADLNTTDRTSIVNAINEVYGIATGSDSVSVTADGVKTFSQILDDLYALIDQTKINEKSILRIGNNILVIEHIDNSKIMFSRSLTEAAKVTNASATLKASSSSYIDAETVAASTSFTNYGSTVATSGDVFKIIY